MELNFYEAKKNVVRAIESAQDEAQARWCLELANEMRFWCCTRLEHIKQYQDVIFPMVYGKIEEAVDKTLPLIDQRAVLLRFRKAAKQAKDRDQLEWLAECIQFIEKDALDQGLDLFCRSTRFWSAWHAAQVRMVPKRRG